MAIKMRRGKLQDFNPDKMLPGEWAVSIDNDTEKQMVWMCFAAGVVKRMGTYEDFYAQIQDITSDIINQFIQALTEAQERLQNDTEAYIQGKVDDEWLPELQALVAKAGNSASSAASSASEAKMSEANAKSSETAAKSSQAAAASSASEAKTSATNAENSADAASRSATAAATSTSEAEDWSKWSQSYAVGEGGKRSEESTDNAKSYYDNTKRIFENFHDLPEVAYVDKVTGVKELTWLSDLDWLSATQDFEATNKDKNCKGDNITLRDCEGKAYVCSKGIGTHANSEIQYALAPGTYDAFEALIGVNAEGDAYYCHGIKFRIYCDVPSGEIELYRDDNEVFTFATPAKYIHVDIPDNATKLRLYVVAVTDTGAAWANWGDAKLISYSDSGCSLENQILDLSRSKLDAKRYDAELGKIEDKIGAKADKENPVLTGKMSLNRKKDSTEGNYSVALGRDTTASSNYSFAEGLETKSSNFASHAEGYQSIASGYISHAEGNNTQATGDNSHAEGEGTQATGSYAHAEGYNTQATGFDSHAEGSNTQATGHNSHAQGVHTIAAGQSQDVIGRYNVVDAKDKYLHIIGNGTGEDSRSNAHTVDWEGNAEYAGDVKANAYGNCPVSLVELHNLIWKECDERDLSNYDNYDNDLWSYYSPENIVKNSCSGHSCAKLVLYPGTYKIVCKTPENVQSDMQFALIRVVDISREPYASASPLMQGGTHILECDSTAYFLVNSTLESGLKIYKRNF